MGMTNTYPARWFSVRFPIDGRSEIRAESWRTCEKYRVQEASLLHNLVIKEFHHDGGCGMRSKRKGAEHQASRGQKKREHGKGKEGNVTEEFAVSPGHTAQTLDPPVGPNLTIMAGSKFLQSRLFVYLFFFLQQFVVLASSSPPAPMW